MGSLPGRRCQDQMELISGQPAQDFYELLRDWDDTGGTRTLQDMKPQTRSSFRVVVPIVLFVVFVNFLTMSPSRAETEGKMSWTFCRSTNSQGFPRNTADRENISACVMQGSFTLAFQERMNVRAMNSPRMITDHSSSLRAHSLSLSRAKYSSTRSRLPSPAR